MFQQVIECDLLRHVCRLIGRQMASVPTWAPWFFLRRLSFQVRCRVSPIRACPRELDQYEKNDCCCGSVCCRDGGACCSIACGARAGRVWYEEGGFPGKVRKQERGEGGRRRLAQERQDGGRRFAQERQDGGRRFAHEKSGES